MAADLPERRAWQRGRGPRAPSAPSLILTHLGSSTPNTRGFRAADLPELRACKGAGPPGRGQLAPAAPTHFHTWAAARRTLAATEQQTYLSWEPAGVMDHLAKVHWHQLHPLILTLGQQHAVLYTRGYKAADQPGRRACKGAGPPGRGPLAPAAPADSHTWAAARSTLEATGQQTYLRCEHARVLDHLAEVHWHRLHLLILTFGQQHATH
jgi:hypothetical protein